MLVIMIKSSWPSMFDNLLERSVEMYSISNILYSIRIKDKRPNIAMYSIPYVNYLVGLK